MKQFQITLKKGWTAGLGVDNALAPHTGLFSSKPREVRIILQTGCALKIAAGIRLLSIANQLALSGANVEIIFEEGQTGAMGYMDRMGFFDHLSPAVRVVPDRPEISGRTVYGGHNSGLVEIVALTPGTRDKELPGKLAETTARLHSNKAQGDRLGDAVYTVFSELIGNVYDHSGSRLDGYAALQSYKPTPRTRVVEIAVSDSGCGILATLRPALARLGHPYADLDDSELLMKAVAEGVSRNGPGYGCGLYVTARKTLILGANVEIRLPDCRMNLIPRNSAYQQRAIAYGADGLAHIEGTHLCLDFRLD